MSKGTTIEAKGIKVPLVSLVLDESLAILILVGDVAAASDRFRFFGELKSTCGYSLLYPLLLLLLLWLRESELF